MAEQELGRLSVIGPFEFTDFSVLDGGLKEVASGTGHIEKDLAPGIYRILARVPGDRVERLVAVDANQTTKVDDLVLATDSLAPVQGARSTDEYHMAPAEALSKTPHVIHGVDATARLFLFLRANGTVRRVAPFFKVLECDGTPVAEFPQFGTFDLEAGWAALTVDLPAGTYVIEQEVPGLGIRGQAVYAGANWTTELFVEWGENGVPNFARASALMRSKGSGFTPASSREYKHTDAALEGLARRRLVLTPDDEYEFFSGKFINPMLGLIGAYASLLRPDLDFERLQLVARNLQILLPDSPDARIISKVVELRGRRISEEDAEVFSTPPMFAVGTEFVMKFAAAVPSVVPSESSLAYIALSLTTGSAWTRWSRDTSPGDSLLDLRELISENHPALDLADRDLQGSIAEQYALPQSVVREALS